MKTKKGKMRLVSAAFLMISLVLIIKVGLTLVSSLSQNKLPLTTPEVLAGDQTVKSKSGNEPVQKEPAPVNSSHSTPSEKTGKSAGGASVAESISFLQKRETELNRREEQLREKENRLAKMEKEVEQKLKDLTSIQKEIQAYHAEKEETKSTKVRSLAKIYGTMKPKEAAKLLENLDDRLVMSIVSTMNSDEAAGILSSMEVKKAAKISEALSGR